MKDIILNTRKGDFLLEPWETNPEIYYLWKKGELIKSGSINDCINFILNYKLKKNELTNAKQNIKELLTLDHIFTKTSIFSSFRGVEAELDEYTKTKIKYNFTIWFNSWIKKDLDIITKY